MPNIMQDLGTKIGSEFKTHRLRIEAVETNKQESLVSGTNIKTINGTSVLGPGDIVTTQTTISGNAGTATKLATARTISLTGDVTGNVSFDGSANVSVTATVADDSHNHVISNVDGLQVALDNKVDKVSKQSLDSNSALRVSGTTVSLYKGDGTFDSITTQDTVYTLPTATSTVKGGIEIFSDTVQAVASNTVSTTAGRTYGIQLNSDGQAVVNVPWSDTNTVYTHPNSGVTAGTYPKVTVNAQGHVTAGASLSASDIPSLDASKITSGTIDPARLPSFVDDVLEFANLAGFPTTGEAGKIYIALDTNKSYRWSGSTYVYITSGAVDSVAGKTGVVTLVKDDVGLSLVDNTSDASKNVLSATKWTTARTIALAGDVTGSASVDGSANVTITTTVQPNSIALGTDTTGNYVAGATAGTGISITGTAGEGWSPVITNTAPNVTTDISITPSTTSVTVNSSDGTDGIISSATTIAAGVMSASDKIKLDGIATGATANTGTVTSVATSGAITGGTITSTGTISHSTADGFLHVPATGTTNNGKVLTAGATAGSLSWTAIPAGITDHTLLSSIGTNTHAQIDTALTRLANTSGTNTGDNAVNSNYENDYRASNFVAGTNYLVPNGSAAALTNFPILNQNTSGNAGTATKLQTSRNIALAGAIVGSVNFDGSADVNISTTLGAQSFIQSSGLSSSWGSTNGTGTGAINAIMGTSSSATWLLSGTSGGVFRSGIQSLDSNGTLRLYSNSNYIEINGNQITGNISTASALATGRTIGMTGDVTWTSASFNGSANVTGTATLANSGVTAGTYKSVTVDAKGRVTAGSNLLATDIPNLDASKITTGTLPVARGGTGVTSGTGTGSVVLSTSPTLTTPNIGAATATSLTISGTGAITGRQSSVATTLTNLSSGISNPFVVPEINVGTAYGYIPMLSTRVLSSAGYRNNISIGAYRPELTWNNSGVYIAMGGNDDYPTEAFILKNGGKLESTLGAITMTGHITGNANTATTLQNARTIGASGDVTGTATSFNGSANITIPMTLANSGVTAGTYKSVTVDAKGRVTAGSNPTTLSGYGITDAYTKTQTDSALALKTNKADTDSVNMLRADKFLAAQNIANMIYTSGDLTKIRYNTDTDSNYEVLNYVSGNLSSINHYTGGVLRGTTTLSYANGNLVSAVFA